MHMISSGVGVFMPQELDQALFQCVTVEAV